MNPKYIKYRTKTTIVIDVCVCVCVCIVCEGQCSEALFYFVLMSFGNVYCVQFGAYYCEG